MGNGVPPFTQLAQPEGSDSSSSESETNGLTENSEEEAQASNSGTQESDDEEMQVEPEANSVPPTPPPPSIEQYLQGLGKGKSKVLQQLHWVAITALAGSANLFVEVIVEKKESYE